MSLMDDVFDVRTALEKLPEAPAFERVVDALWHYEEASDKLTRLLSRINDVQWALNELKRTTNEAMEDK